MKRPQFGFLKMLLLGLAFAGPFSHALEVNRTEMEGIQYIMLSGPFTDDLLSSRTRANFRDSMLINQELGAASRGSSPWAVIVSSEGGSREGALRTASLLGRWSAMHMQKFHSPMVIAFVGQCSSACTFLAAELTRLRGENLLILTVQDTQFHFHGPTDYVTGKPLPLVDFNYHLEAGLKQYQRSGVNKFWLSRNRQMFFAPAGKTFTGRALCAEGSQIVPSDSCVANYEEIEKRIAALQSHSPVSLIFDLFNTLTNFLTGQTLR